MQNYNFAKVYVFHMQKYIPCIPYTKHSFAYAKYSFANIYGFAHSNGRFSTSLLSNPAQGISFWYFRPGYLSRFLDYQKTHYGYLGAHHLIFKRVLEDGVGYFFFFFYSSDVRWMKDNFFFSLTGG